MSNLSCGTHVAEPSANKDCRKLLNQFCRFLPKLKLPISADAKLPLTDGKDCMKETVQANYRRIKEEVKQIVQEELERIANDENLKHLLQQK